MEYLRNNGLTEFAKYYILHPTETFLPPDNRVYYYKWQDYKRFYILLKRALQAYSKNMDASFYDFTLHMRGVRVVRKCLKLRFYTIASSLIIMLKMYRVKLSPKYVHYTNFYAKK